MPIYIFKCPECSKIFEILISWNGLFNEFTCECGRKFIPHSHLCLTKANVHMRGIFTNLNKISEKNKQLKNKYQ